MDDTDLDARAVNFVTFPDVISISVMFLARYVPADPARLVEYTTLRRDQLPQSDVFVSYPPQAELFQRRQWRGVHPKM
jgi:hypothetical protein